MTLTIRLLGPFRVEVEGRTVGEDRWPRRDAASRPNNALWARTELLALAGLPY